MSNSLYCGPVEKLGTEEQKKTWLAPYASGAQEGGRRKREREMYQPNHLPTFLYRLAALAFPSPATAAMPAPPRLLLSSRVSK